MRAGLGLLIIVLALAIVGVLIKKSIHGDSTPAAAAAAAAQHAGVTGIQVDPNANVAEQSRQLQNQVRQQVESAQSPKHDSPDE